MSGGIIARKHDERAKGEPGRERWTRFAKQGSNVFHSMPSTRVLTSFGTRTAPTVHFRSLPYLIRLFPIPRQWRPLPRSTVTPPHTNPANGKCFNPLRVRAPSLSCISTSSVALKGARRRAARGGAWRSGQSRRKQAHYNTLHAHCYPDKNGLHTWREPPGQGGAQKGSRAAARTHPHIRKGRGGGGVS